MIATHPWIAVVASSVYPPVTLLSISLIFNMPTGIRESGSAKGMCDWSVWRIWAVGKWWRKLLERDTIIYGRPSGGARPSHRKGMQMEFGHRFVNTGRVCLCRVRVKTQMCRAARGGVRQIRAWALTASRDITARQDLGRQCSRSDMGHPQARCRRLCGVFFNLFLNEYTSQFSGRLTESIAMLR